MNILYVGMKHDYGDPLRGESFEEANFKSSLVGMGHNVVHFDFMERAQAVGISRMREEIVDFARSQPLDVVFFFLFENEFDAVTLRRVGSAANAPTVNWFADDHWRFRDFSATVAPGLDWVVTTDFNAVSKYRRIGIQNVILSQWACNDYVYKPSPQPSGPEVSFVGQPHGNRLAAMDMLRAADIEPTCFGFGWPSGRLTTQEMINLFSSSSINLNLANGSQPSLSAVLKKRLIRRNSVFTSDGLQIKGRTFEIPGCGGFQLTQAAPGLQDYFEIGSEIGVFKGDDDFVRTTKYWLHNADEREAVAQAGLARVRRDHTYSRRFKEIFATMNLPNAAGNAH
jgi:spore maturation protein CgeB